MSGADNEPRIYRGLKDVYFERSPTTFIDGKAGELRYAKSGSNTYVTGDTDGDGKTDFAIHIDKAITLDKGDFLL